MTITITAEEKKKIDAQLKQIIDQEVPIILQ